MKEKELIPALHGTYFYGANRAKNKLYGELNILGINLDKGIFDGQSIQSCTIYSNLKMIEFYFYEFH